MYGEGDSQRMCCRVISYTCITCLIQNPMQLSKRKDVSSGEGHGDLAVDGSKKSFASGISRLGIRLALSLGYP